MSLNTSIPRFQCFVRERYLYNLEEGHPGLVPGVAFAVASIPGRSLGFHVLLQNGAMVGRLPPSALAHVPNPGPELATHLIQLWDCFSYDVSAVEYDFLQGMRCQVKLRNGVLAPGAYMFTVDWCGSRDAEDVGDLGWKCGHVIALDDGNIAIQPNNRIRWAEPSFVDHRAEWPPKYKTINYVMTCEKHGRLVIEDDRMFFETKEEEE
jgi:hypothetical protein